MIYIHDDLLPTVRKMPGTELSPHPYIIMFQYNLLYHCMWCKPLILALAGNQVSLCEPFVLAV